MIVFEQQKQIEFLVVILSGRNVVFCGGGFCRCWVCDFCGYLWRDCINRVKNFEVVNFVVKGEIQGKCKLIVFIVVSYVVGEYLMDGGLIIENVLGDCLEVKVREGGVDVGCLIDIGEEVLIIMESFYKEFLVQGREVIDVIFYIRILVFQGLEIFYVDYVEFQLIVFFYKFEGLGFLIVKDLVLILI